MKIQPTGLFAFRLLVASLLLFATARSAVAQFTYYVSPNGLDARYNVTARNRDRPWRTIQKAVNSAEAGSTIVVLDGDYYEHVYMPRGSLTVRAENQQVPLLVGSIGSNGIGNVTIDGLRVSNRVGGGPVTKGIWFSHCNNLLIRNNRVYSCIGGGISADQCDNTVIEWNITHSNAFWDVAQHSGISVYQPRDVNRSTAQASQTGIHIRNNTSFSNQNLLNNPIWGRPTDGNGIVVDDTRNLTAPSGNNQTYIKKVVVENNLCYFNGGQGVHCYQSDNVLIRNNTCYKNLISFDFGGEVSVVKSRNVNVINNILFARDGRYVNLQYEATNVRWDANLLHNGGSHPEVFNRPLTVYANPHFENGSFRLRATSPAINRGIESTSGFFLDVNGNPRLMFGVVDLGAVEFGN